MAQQDLSEGRAKDITSQIDTPAAHFDYWWLLMVAVIGMIAWLVFGAGDPYDRAYRYIIDGVWITIQVTGISFLITLVVGLISGLGRLSRNWLIKGIATLYVEVIRGIPLLVQLLFWYFAFTAIVRNLGTTYNIPALQNYLSDPLVTAIIGLTVCYGAYMSEIYRAGIQSIGKGQMEAARSLGMSQAQAMRYIILPQAVRVIMPPIGNEFISMLKDSSLVSVVAVADLTRRGREFMSTTATPIETWTMVALLYLVLTILSARLVNWIERKTKLQER